MLWPRTHQTALGLPLQSFPAQLSLTQHSFHTKAFLQFCHRENCDADASNGWETRARFVPAANGGRRHGTCGTSRSHDASGSPITPLYVLAMSTSAKLHSGKQLVLSETNVKTAAIFWGPIQVSYHMKLGREPENPLDVFWPFVTVREKLVCVECVWAAMVVRPKWAQWKKTNQCQRVRAPP